MSRTITIDPITRLEGHGKISIFVDDAGEVERALLQVPELRGFEAFCVGRPAEEMPQITSRICGICPAAHHIAATKALDDLYGVEPTATAAAIRQLFYNLFIFEDHALHFFYLAAPDFIVGPDADPRRRNVLGLLQLVDAGTGARVLAVRHRARALMARIGGKPIHPVLGLPGGVSKGIDEALRSDLRAFAVEAVDFARFALDLFRSQVWEREEYRELMLGETFCEPTNDMGLVDGDGCASFYEGALRVVDPAGVEVERLGPGELGRYSEIFAERVEPFSYIKFPYLRRVGWQGFVGGAQSGIVRVGPLARLNAARGLSTPQAQQAHQQLHDEVGAGPLHQTLLTHWARLIELLNVAERTSELVELTELCGSELRNRALATPREGIGVVEAPRGTLLHHYKTDERGVLTDVNLLVATLFNSASICMSIERAARAFIQRGEVSEGLLNRVEMAFRAYDPCLSCATHAAPGRPGFDVVLSDRRGTTLGRVVRQQGKDVVIDLSARGSNDKE